MGMVLLLSGHAEQKAGLRTYLEYKSDKKQDSTFKRFFSWVSLTSKRGTNGDVNMTTSV